MFELNLSMFDILTRRKIDWKTNIGVLNKTDTCLKEQKNVSIDFDLLHIIIWISLYCYLFRVHGH